MLATRGGGEESAPQTREQMNTPESASRASSRPVSAAHSRPTSAANSRADSTRASTPSRPAAEVKAEKLATIGMMLHKRGEPDGLAHLQQSLHLDPTNAHVWKALGQALAQDGKPAVASSAFRSAAELSPPGEDAAARTGLATMLTQLGQPGAATDELLKVRSARGGKSTAAASLMAEPIERLCRRLMPGTRFASLQSSERALAWKNALLTACPRATRILDISSTPLPAMMAIQQAGVQRTVLRVESLPMSVVTAALSANGQTERREASRPSSAYASRVDEPPVKLISAGANGLPLTPGDVTAHGVPEVLLADSDAHDILASSFLPTIRAAREELVSETPTVLPSALEVHVALVQSQELARLNSISEPIGGFDIGALNTLSHRSRAVRLSDLKHVVLTQACTALRVNLDAKELPVQQGQTSFDLKLERSGTAHAVVVWHTMKLHGNQGITTAPGTASEQDNGTRQVAYYLWSANPGESDWEMEVQQAREAAAAAAEAAEIARSTASAAQAAAAAASEAAASSEESATYAHQLACDAEEVSEPARERVELEAVPWATDGAAIEAADNATAFSLTAKEMSEEAKAKAAIVRVAADTAVELAARAEAAAQVAAAASVTVSDDVLPKTVASELQAWSVAKEVALAAEAAAKAAHDTAVAASAAEPAVEEDEDEEELPTFAMAEEEEDEEAIAERAVKAARAVRSEAVAAARQASADAAEAVATLGQGSAARSSRGTPAIAARAANQPEGAAVKRPAVGDIFLKKGQPVTLRLRWRPRRVEFQLCGRPEAKPTAVDLTPAAGAPSSDLRRDAQGRIITPTGRIYLVAVRVKVRAACELASAEAGIAEKGTKVHVLERRELVDVATDTTMLRALIQLEGAASPMGWLSCLTKSGEETLIATDDPRAADIKSRPASAKANVQSEAPAAAPEAASPTSVLLARTAPESTRVSEQNFGTASYSQPLSAYHFPMVNDTARNDAFAAALVKSISKLQPSLVLDIGSGTGLLAMLAAARGGAPRVLAVEMTPELAAIATELVNSHGLSHAVRVMPCHSSQVHLDPPLTDDDEPTTSSDPWQRRADLLVFEILGTDPLCEGLLPALRDARARLLSPTAAVLPCALEVHVALVQSEDLARINSITEPVGGLDLSALNTLSHRTRAVRLSELKHVVLTKACTALRLDLDAEEPPELEGESEVEIHVAQTGTAHAVVSWFTAHLDHNGSIAVSTAPGVAEPMRGHSWGQSAHFLPGGVQVTRHQTLRLNARWSDNGVTFVVVEPEKRVIKPSANIARLIAGELDQVEKQSLDPLAGLRKVGNSPTKLPPAHLVPEPPKLLKPAPPTLFKRGSSGRPQQTQ